MPLLRGTDVVGVIELFSSQPYAFGVRDERTLEVLADRTLRNLEHAGRPLELQAEPAVMTLSEPEPEPEPEPGPEEAMSAEGEEQNVPSRQVVPVQATEPEGPRKRDWASLSDLGAAGWMVGALALACAALLGLVLGWQFGTQNADQQAHSDLNAPTAAPPTNTPKAPVKDTNARGGLHPVSAKPSAAPVPPGGLQVFENGKEVFRMPPNQEAKANRAMKADQAMQPASSLEPENVMESSPTAAEGSLVRRVEPQYPEAARQQNIQGTVVLEAHINAQGGVQDVQMVSGPGLLAQAATDAVKQWKFKPRLVNGTPVEMQTRITLNFRLPQ
jgi:TonB family protein